MNFNKKAYSAINDLISKEYPKVRLMIVSKNRQLNQLEMLLMKEHFYLEKIKFKKQI